MKINGISSPELTGGQSVAFDPARAQARQPAEADNTPQKEIDPQELQKAVDKLQVRADLANGAIEFSTDQDTGKRIVKVVDKSTHDVLMQIPSKVALAIAEDSDKSNGLLVSQKV